jgi:hypothetical protein
LGAFRTFSSALLLATAVCALASPAAAGDIELSDLQTDHLSLLYYDPIQTYLTPYVARSYENSFAFHHRMFDWTPWDKPVIYLRDLRDTGQAGVHEVPSNAITVDIAPFPTTFETWSPGERFFTLMNHELGHIATTDLWNDDDAFWRHLFHGKPAPIADHPESILYSYLAAPRTLTPRWYLEGSAVFLETWMGGGLGRAQGGYDEMVFRAMVRDDAHFYDPLGLESEGTAVDFQIGANDYLYGTRFQSYLALIYGPDKLVAWLKRGNGSKAYYANQFEQVFGKPLDDAWQDWIKWEHDWQRANLASVQKYPTTPVTRLTPHALGSVSRTFYDPKTDSLIAGFREPGFIANLGVVSLKDGSIRKLTNIKGPALYRVTSLAYDAAHEKAFYTTDNNAYRDLMEIDIASGKTRMLLEDARIGDIAFNPIDETIWGVRHLNGIDTLVRINPGHSDWNLIATFPYGRAVTDLDVSPDGQYLSASVGEINGDQRLDVFRIDELMAGEVRSIASLQLGQSVPESGVFSPDGKYVYATAYYTGVSNIYRLDVAKNTYEAVSNAVTGFFRPLPMADGSLIAYEYTGAGLQPVMIDPKPVDDLSSVRFLGTEVADKHPEVKTWAVGSPAKIDLDQRITSQGYYIPRDEMRLMASYPDLEGYKGHIALGWHVRVEDPMEFNLLAANVSYSPADNIRPGEQFHANVSYSTLFWQFKYWHNDANFYDLFGPVDRSRKGDAIMAGYHQVLIYDSPRQLDFATEATFYSGLDTLPGAQNVPSGASSLGTFKAALNFSNVDQSLGAVDYEDGYRANAALQLDYQRSKFFPKFRGGFDIGTALPWAHTSAWLYNAAGFSTGAKTSPLDYFYFGSFGNNFVDDGEVKRYRSYDSFPGFDIDAVDARAFAKSVGELNLPPVRFEDLGTAAAYLSSIRPAVFAGVLFADPGAKTSRTFENVGAQLDFNFTVAVRLPMTLSVGYARGFGPAPGRHDEIMVSLKIL